MSNVTFNTKACFERVTPTLFVSSFGLLCPIIYSSCYPDCGVDLLMGRGKRKNIARGRVRGKKGKERRREGGDLPLFSSHFLTEGLFWGYRVIDKINRPFLFFFSTFDLYQLEKIHRHNWKSELN